MSFLKKLFGAKSFEELLAEADALFDGARPEDARMIYQRALEKKGGSEADVARCRDRVAACLDLMAEGRIAEAERLVEAGHLDLAATELENAIETAASSEVAEKARRRRDTLERADAKERAEAPIEMTDEDRWAVLAGAWDEARLDEYDEYGDRFRDALLAFHDGETEAARVALEALIEEHGDEACYLWLDVARARLTDGDVEEGEEALRELLDRLPDDESPDVRIAAHAELAAIADRDDDEEAAIAELQAVVTALPEDHRGFLLLGRYLREKGYPEEAVDVLEGALDLLDERRPDLQVFQELGLAKVAAGDDASAEAYFDRVVAQSVALRRGGKVDIPPTTGLALAAIYERTKRLEKAADIFRSLADGSDRDGHLRYHREAARLLDELELDEEARRMWTRALALAEGDDELTAEIEARLER